MLDGTAKSDLQDPTDDPGLLRKPQDAAAFTGLLNAASLAPHLALGQGDLQAVCTQRALVGGCSHLI